MRGKHQPPHPAGERGNTARSRARFLPPRCPLSAAKGEGERLLPSASARSDRRDEARHAGVQHHPLRARCAPSAAVTRRARRRAAGTGMAADCLTAPSPPEPRRSGAATEPSVGRAELASLA